MLASLLPGIREIRSPLAAGYLWLVALWLAFADRIPPPDQATGVLHDIYAVAQGAGPSAILVAASFAAYLIGALSVQLSNLAAPTIGVLRPRGRLTQALGERFGRLATGPTADSRRAVKHRSVLSDNGQTYLREAATAELVSRSITDEVMQQELRELHGLGIRGRLDDPAVRSTLVEIRYDIDTYARQLEKDLPAMPLRIIRTDREIYTEFDRLRAEAEFRAAVAVPLFALIVVVGWRVSGWWLLALVIPVLLVFDARRSATAAADVLAAAIRSRVPGITADDLRGPLVRREGWLRVAASTHQARGAMVRYAAERALARDHATATEYFRKAGRAGSPDAQFWIAMHTDVGDQLFELLIESAAAGGVPKAAEMLADAGPAGVAAMRRALARDREAMLEAGRRYEAAEDYVRAEDWYRRVVDPNENDAAGRADVERMMRRSAGRAASAEMWKRTTDLINARTGPDLSAQA